MKLITFSCLFFLFGVCGMAQPKISLDQSEVRKIVTSNDGHFLGAIYKDMSVKIWTIPDGKLVLDFKELEETNDLVFSMDSRFLFTVSNGNKARFWSCMSGELIKAVDFGDKGFNYMKTATDISPDGKHVAFGEKMFRAGIFNLETGALTVRRTNSSEYVHFVKYGPEGKKLYVGGSQGSITVFNTSDYTSKRYKINSEFTQDMDVSSDGKILIMGTVMSNKVYVVNTTTMSSIKVINFDEPIVSVDAGSGFAVINMRGGTANILNLTTHSIVKTIKTSDQNSSVMKIGAKGKYLFSGDKNGEIKLWNTSDYSFAKTLNASSARVIDLDGSIQGDRLLVAYSNNLIKQWNLNDLTVETMDAGNEGLLQSVSYNPLNSLVVSTSSEGTARIWDSKSAVLKTSIKRKDDLIKCARYSSKGELIVSTEKGKLGIYGTDEKPLISYDVMDKPATHLEISSAGSHALIWSSKEIRVVDLKTGKVTLEVTNIKDRSISGASLSPNMPYLSYSFRGSNTIRVYDYLTVQEIEKTDFKNIETKKGRFYITPVGISNVAFNNKGNLIVMTRSNISDIYDLKTEYITNSYHKNDCISRDFYFMRKNALDVFVNSNGSISLYKRGSTKPILSMISGGLNESFIYTPEGYYSGSKEMLSDLKFTYNGVELNHSSFDLTYNRPDLILRALNPAHDLADQLSQVYQKRVEKAKKAGQNGSAGVIGAKVPELTLSLSHLPLSTNSNEIEFDAHFEGKGVAITQFQIQVNGVPVAYELKGIANRSVSFTEKIKLILSEGNNQIDLSCRSKTGAWSLNKQFIVRYTPDKSVKKRIFFVGIGASDYQKLTSLENADDDVRFLIDFYRSNLPEGYSELVVDTLFGRNVSKSSVLKMKERLTLAREDDLVMVYYAGHGFFDEQNNYYLGTYATDTANPAMEALDFESLNELLSNIGSRKKVLLINACQSGEFDEDLDLFNKMNSYFIDLRPSNGAYIISSSNANEFASAGSSRIRKPMTVFGYSLLETLKSNPGISIGNLSGSLNKKVYKYSRSMQNVSVRKTNPHIDFKIR